MRASKWGANNLTLAWKPGTGGPDRQRERVGAHPRALFRAQQDLRRGPDPGRERTVPGSAWTAERAKCIQGCISGVPRYSCLYITNPVQKPKNPAAHREPLVPRDQRISVLPLPRSSNSKIRLVRAVQRRQPRARSRVRHVATVLVPALQHGVFRISTLGCEFRRRAIMHALSLT